MSRHPLDDEFNVVGTSFDDDFDDAVKIPEDKEKQDLQLIIDLALKQYKLNADDFGLLDPKTRIKYMEINATFLNTAKDARYKLEMLEMKRTKGSGKKATESATEEPTGGRTRSEIAAEVTRLKAVK